MSYQFEITRRVEFSETDQAGIMHFSNFFRFMESAEHAFFRSLGFSVAQCRNGLEVCLPRVHAECDYAVPLRFEDEVRVRLLVERKGWSSITYQFRFSRVGDSRGSEVARGRLTVASVERQADGTMKAVPLPKAIADHIQQAPAEILGDGLPAKAGLSSSNGQRGRSRPTAPLGSLAPRPDRSSIARARLRRGLGLRPGAGQTVSPRAGSVTGAPVRNRRPVANEAATHCLL
jgi:acyl-CoA thioester hydrolase